MSFLLIVAVAMLRSRDTLTAVMLSGLYSLISASLFLLLDAADVAFTEAAVGAGMTTVLMLSTLRIVGSRQSSRRRRAWPALIITVLCGSALIYGTLDLPPFGDAGNIVHHHVADHYLQQTASEIDIPNVVTAVLASYRGFDTLGETAVVFTAGLAVLLLIGGRRQQADNEGEPADRENREHSILAIVAKFLIPLIVLFALYVQFHGDFSPGGGFQAGVIFAAAMILHLLVFGIDATEQAMPAKVLRVASAIGVLIYGGVGIAAMLGGGNFLDYDALAANPVSGQHLGILLVELGVGITVASVMVLLAYVFHQRGRDA